MKVVLFGNRGSRPIGASENSPFAKYGGDTTAVGIACDDGKLIALDSGSGFWKWPYTLETYMERKPPYDIDLFYTHYHDDHTMGIPQSPLLFTPGNTLRFYGPDFEPGLKGVFNAKANRPCNPDLGNFYQATRKFRTLKQECKKRSLKLDNGAVVKWMPVPHGTEQSYAYRIEHNGATFCFVSDTHHTFEDDKTTPVLDQNIVEFIRGADAMVYDCHYSDEEFEKIPFLRTMGHSTGEHGVRLCEAASVPVLVTHHHDPNKTDEALDKLTASFAKYGKKHGVAVIAAKPSLILDLSLDTEDMLTSVESQGTPMGRYKEIRRMTRSLK